MSSTSFETQYSSCEDSRIKRSSTSYQQERPSQQRQQTSSDLKDVRSIYRTIIVLISLIVIGVIVKQSSQNGGSVSDLSTVSQVSQSIDGAHSSANTVSYSHETNPSSKGTSTGSNIKKTGDSSYITTYTLKRDGNYDALTYFDPAQVTHLTYTFLKPYQAVIEPYASMTLSFYGFDSLPSNSTYYYEYIVCPIDNLEQSCQSGAMYIDTSTSNTVTTSIYFACEPHQTYTFLIFAIDSLTSTVLEESESLAICMYVRREIRSYSTEDLNAFLDASYTLNSVDQDAGEELYGSSYFSASTLSRLHFYNAAQRDADHIHEGNGFLMQHIKLTNFFEAAIQSVNPSVVVPYWDFTIDRAEGRTVFTSLLSSPDYYGTVTYPKGDMLSFTRPDNHVEDARISDGRWANQIAELNTYFPDLYAGYGYLRAPWCNNPSPYLSRYSYDWDVTSGYLPSCESHYEMLEVTDKMYLYFFDMSFAPHAPAHTAIGGIFGCDALNSWTTAGYFTNTTMQEKACVITIAAIKTIYRAGLIEVSKDCIVDSDDYTSSDCAFVCRTTDPSYIATAVEMLYDLTYTLYDWTNTEVVNNDTVSTLLASFICGLTDAQGNYLWGSMSQIYVGEHTESASVADPSFWVIHPTLDRLTHAKFMSGGFDDETWPSDPVDDFVCMNSLCYDEITDITDYFTSCCYGHYEMDTMYDGRIGSRTAYLGDPNAVVLAKMDPWSDDYEMPYIYDDFEWLHCIEQGYDFQGILDEVYLEYLEVNGLLNSTEIEGEMERKNDHRRDMRQKKTSKHSNIVDEEKERVIERIATPELRDKMNEALSAARELKRETRQSKGRIMTNSREKRDSEVRTAARRQSVIDKRRERGEKVEAMQRKRLDGEGGERGEQERLRERQRVRERERESIIKRQEALRDKMMQSSDRNSDGNKKTNTHTKGKTHTVSKSKYNNKNNNR